MKLPTTRFGVVEIEADDILLFPSGVAGYEHLRHWVLLADSENESVGWLQSVADGEVALPVVSPRRYAPHYQVRVSAGQMAALQLAPTDEAYVLVVASRNDGQFTLNLRAPLVINLDRRLGRQVITSDDQPVQHAIGTIRTPLRKTA